jgi:TetR/AcrR family transcriptional regulator, tetracycline repressor protein
VALDRKKVVRAALRLLDKVGFDGLTLRGLAGELGVQAPALYWHFKNKQELLDEMATSVLVDSIQDMLPGERGDWRQWAMYFGKEMRRMLLLHRDGAKMFSGTYLTDSSVFESMEFSLRKFVDAGFSIQDAACAFKTIYSYTVGFTIEEQAVYPKPGKRDPRYDPAARGRRIDSERFPLAVAAGQEMYDFDDHFDRGLQVIIRGLATSAKMTRPKPTAKTRAARK